MNSELFKDQAEILNEKRKSVKTGSNVVHIDYYGDLLNADDLNEYFNLLKTNSLELSSFDKSGVVYNDLEDYSNLISVALGDELTKNVIFNVVGSFVWETIKTIIKRIFIKTDKQEINSFYGKGQVKKKQTTFGISLSLDKNTGFNFRLDSNFNSETIDKSLDQAVDFIKNQTPNDSYSLPVFLYYDHENTKWVPVNIMEDISKTHLKKKKKGKKGKKNGL